MWKNLPLSHNIQKIFNRLVYQIDVFEYLPEILITNSYNQFLL